MNLKNAAVDNKIVDIISEDEYVERYDTFNNPMVVSSTGVEVERNGEKYILPIRGSSDDRPGIYPDGCIYFTRTSEEYNVKNLEVIDFSNVDSVQEFIKQNGQIRKMEADILTDVDSVFSPTPEEDDEPEMKAFKEAIISKHIDINKYAPRFGSNFLNDKRILKSNSITRNKLVSMCDKLDIEVEMILRDKNPEVVNPMNKEIKVILTSKGDEE